MGAKHSDCDSVLYLVFFEPSPISGGDVGEKIWWLLCKSQSSKDHSDSLQTVSHEQKF